MKKQSGIGLIEMMIAMTIGLVLVLGLSSVFLTMRRTFTTRQSMAMAQSNQRFGMSFLDVAVRGAGAFSNPVTNSAAILFPAAVSPYVNPVTNVPVSFTAGQALLGAGANANADSVSVRFGADPGTANQGCFAQLNSGDVYLDTFTVSGGFLQCTEKDITTNAAAVTTNLVSGVTAMNIVFGVDTNGSGSVTQYQSGDSVTANLRWGNVKTVQVQLVFNNPLANDPGQAANSTVAVIKTIPYMVGL